ncbi:MAG: hypothetical protein AUH13_26345 [Acidobacteria bacterium 13_2_20CM_58_27]|nr:MAG: hypothetical protein AUH13_26345 [Acidobacteria bacterium 13_2_20CM_58_27]
MLHHSLGGLAGPVRTIVRIAENCVIPELAGADVETLNHFRKEGVFDVRHDDAERPTIARGEVARVNIRELPPKRFTVESTSRCVRRPTLPVLFKTLETVAVETPAAFSTSRIVRPMLDYSAAHRRFRLVFSVRGTPTAGEV